MTWKASSSCSPFFTSALWIFSLGVPSVAWACAGGEEEIESRTTFDPHVLRADQLGLRYDPNVLGFGGACATCAADEMRAEWGGYWGTAVKVDDWMQILLEADLPAIDALIVALKGKGKPPPGFDKNGFTKTSDADRTRRVAALYFVGFARRVEAFTQTEKKVASVGSTLRDSGDKALAHASDPFLRQRYAFQLLRVRFYQADDRAVVAFHREQLAVLAGPSPSLKWRADYYLSGALKRTGDLPRANLLLGLINVGYSDLSVETAEDFRPKDDAEWKASLALAKTPLERAALWQLVGLHQDGVAGLHEIEKLNPSAEVIPLLLVRELTRMEDAHQGDTVALAKDAARLSQTPGVARPWIDALVAAHASALGGDLPSTRQWLDLAKKLQPNDVRVESQIRATLSLALAKVRKASQPALEEELVGTLGRVGHNFDRAQALTATVRQLLSKSSQAAHLDAEAELLDPQRPEWTEPRFIEAMLAYVGGAKTAFQHFVVHGSRIDEPLLEHELGLSHLKRGELDEAARYFQSGHSRSSDLGVDPFLIHIKDCHDCDQAAYGTRKSWDQAKFVKRMQQLQKQSQANGEAAAKAGLFFGNGLYNMTYYGNARSILADSHSQTSDAAPAERAYKLAFEQSHNRELKAQLAFLAAKSELAQLIQRDTNAAENSLPVPKTWFAVVKTFADTQYHREIVAECGHYKAWLHQGGRR